MVRTNWPTAVTNAPTRLAVLPRATRPIAGATRPQRPAARPWSCSSRVDRLEDGRQLLGHDRLQPAAQGAHPGAGLGLAVLQVAGRDLEDIEQYDQPGRLGPDTRTAPAGRARSRTRRGRRPAGSASRPTTRCWMSRWTASKPTGTSELKCSQSQTSTCSPDARHVPRCEVAVPGPEVQPETGRRGRPGPLEGTPHDTRSSPRPSCRRPQCRAAARPERAAGPVGAGGQRGALHAADPGDLGHGGDQGR